VIASLREWATKQVSRYVPEEAQGLAWIRVEAALGKVRNVATAKAYLSQAIQYGIADARREAVFGDAKKPSKYAVVPRQSEFTHISGRRAETPIVERAAWNRTVPLRVRMAVKMRLEGFGYEEIAPVSGQCKSSLWKDVVKYRQHIRAWLKGQG